MWRYCWSHTTCDHFLPYKFHMLPVTWQGLEVLYRSCLQTGKDVACQGGNHGWGEGAVNKASLKEGFEEGRVKRF